MNRPPVLITLFASGLCLLHGAAVCSAQGCPQRSSRGESRGALRLGGLPRSGRGPTPRCSRPARAASPPLQPANALFRTGSSGRAIAEYQRAFDLRPRDRDPAQPGLRAQARRRDLVPPGVPPFLLPLPSPKHTWLAGLLAAWATSSRQRRFLRRSAQARSPGGSGRAGNLNLLRRLVGRAAAIGHRRAVMIKATAEIRSGPRGLQRGVHRARRPQGRSAFENGRWLEVGLNKEGAKAGSSPSRSSGRRVRNYPSYGIDGRRASRAGETLGLDPGPGLARQPWAPGTTVITPRRRGIFAFLFLRAEALGRGLLRRGLDLNGRPAGGASKSDGTPAGPARRPRRLGSAVGQRHQAGRQVLGRNRTRGLSVGGWSSFPLERPEAGPAGRARPGTACLAAHGANNIIIGVELTPAGTDIIPTMPARAMASVLAGLAAGASCPAAFHPPARQGTSPSTTAAVVTALPPWPTFGRAAAPAPAGSRAARRVLIAGLVILLSSARRRPDRRGRNRGSELVLRLWQTPAETIARRFPIYFGPASCWPPRLRPAGSPGIPVDRELVYGQP